LIDHRLEKLSAVSAEGGHVVLFCGHSPPTHPKEGTLRAGELKQPHPDLKKGKNHLVHGSLKGGQPLHLGVGIQKTVSHHEKGTATTHISKPLFKNPGKGY
jgi:hypothetical protein